MIISTDITPNKKLYYLGGLIIDDLIKNQNREIKFLDVFQQVNHKEKISIGLLTFAMDWLYLINVITIKNGRVTKCF